MQITYIQLKTANYGCSCTNISFKYTELKWSHIVVVTISYTHIHTHNRLKPFVWDYPGVLVPEETFTHSHPSWSSNILYQFPPSITIHSILFVPFTCLTVTVFFHNLCPHPLWSSSWSRTFYFVLCTFSIVYKAMINTGQMFDYEGRILKNYGMTRR